MFTKVLGFFIFLFIFGMGFSMLIFLSLFVGYWLTLLGIESVNPKLAHKMVNYKQSTVPLVLFGLIAVPLVLLLFVFLIF